MDRGIKQPSSTYYSTRVHPKASLEHNCKEDDILDG
jgi:hypothetical protein